MKRMIAWLLLLLLLPCSALADLEVHFVDVGQGDCTIVLCDGESMIIDGGPPAASDLVFSYIRETLGLRHVDYVVSTHPHLDHVGGLAGVLHAIPAEVVLTPVLEWDSGAFNNMLKYAAAQGAPVAVPEEGESFPLGGAMVTVLHCWPEAVDLVDTDGKHYARTNDASIVLRVDYGKTAFIFTGDAEDWSEYMMLNADMNLKADVLRVAHHGSRYSSTPEFLRAVQPAYAVISVGKENSYGHPHQATLDRLAEVGAQVLRTDELGSIVMVSNGEEIRERLTIPAALYRIEPVITGKFKTPRCLPCELQKDGLPFSPQL